MRKGSYEIETTRLGVVALAVRQSGFVPRVVRVRIKVSVHPVRRNRRAFVVSSSA
jgi:hypothetical protein